MRNLLVDRVELSSWGKLKHMLWGLKFMKVYGKERTMCSLVNSIDHKTFQKWVWLFVIAITNLEVHVVSLFAVSFFIS